MRDDAIRSGIEMMQRGLELILLNLEPDEPREPPKPQEWLTRKELIERLGIAPGTATRIIKKLEEQGKGVVRFGKGVRVDLEEVKRWKTKKQECGK